jgi:transcriptional regulator with XRE-family HTH domain
METRIMSLAEWLEENCLTHEDFAVMCGCTRAAVTRWASGSRLPSPKWLKVIERKTKGQVVLRYNSYMSEGERLRLALRKQGLTLSAAAKKMRIHRNTLTRFIQGQSDTPSNIVERIYKAVGATWHK